MEYKASVVIPNLNGAGWLRDSIESVWAQTEQNFELIVIDNGSKDESLDIARSYCGRENYTLIENGAMQGMSVCEVSGIYDLPEGTVKLFAVDGEAGWNPLCEAELL